MTAYLPTEYEITNNNSVDARLDIAGHQLRVPAGATVKLHTSTRLGDLPVIPGIDITQNNLPDVYVPFGGLLVEGEILAVGDTSKVNFTGNLANADIDKASIRITDGVEIFIDTDGDGVLVGNLGGIGTIDVFTGAYDITFDAAPAAVNITADYLHRGNKTVR